MNQVLSDTQPISLHMGDVQEQAAGELSRLPECVSLCVYLDVYGLCLSGTEQFAASFATLVYCPVACHLDLWQGQPKD